RGGPVQVLPEGRQLVTPVLTAVEREVDPAVVEPDATVVLPGHQIAVIGRVDRDRLFRLPAERAVLVNTDVAVGRVAVAAADRIDVGPGLVAAGVCGVVGPDVVAVDAHHQALDRGRCSQRPARDGRHCLGAGGGFDLAPFDVALGELDDRAV